MSHGSCSSVTRRPDGWRGLARRTGAGLAASALAALLAFATPVFAQSAVDGFDPNANNGVSALAVQADGRVLVGGAFTQIGGLARNRIARLKVDGSVDAGFDPNANGIVWSLAVQADGKILAVGTFTQIGGQARNRVARLNADGSLDASFDPNVNDVVYTVAAQADGKVLVAGSFGSVGGQTRGRIARLNADGSLDPMFDPDANGIVNSIAVQADGKVLAGGNFTQIGGQARGHVARLNADGSLDASFNPNANGNVSSLAVQADGKIVVAGVFSAIGGQARNNVARLDADGSLDMGFDPNANDNVYSVAVQADGKVLVGGQFTQAGGQVRKGIARFRIDGSLDAGFDPNVTGSVYTLAALANGKLLIGGNFAQVGGQARNSIARIEAGGRLDAVFNPNLTTGSIWGLATQADGKVLIGGTFTQVGGLARKGLARLNVDGSVDTGFDPMSDPSIVASQVYSFAMQADGKLLAAGAINTSNDGGQTVRARGLLRFNADGSLDAGFDPFPPPLTNAITPLVAVQADGKLFVGGQFSVLDAGGQERKHFVRFNADGSLDPGFEANVNGDVHNLAVQADGKLLISGPFTQVGGQPRNQIARLNADGSLDAGFNVNVTGFVPSSSTPPLIGERIHAMTVQTDGKVLIGGPFTQVNGQTRDGIARLNADGSLDAYDPFPPPKGSQFAIHTLALQADGKLLIGGKLDTVPSAAIARINADGSLDADFAPQSADAGGLWGIALQADGKVLAGGGFFNFGIPQSSNWYPRTRIARLSLPDAALQSLSASNDGTSVQWLRSGAEPELSRVWFERSDDDGAHWAALGAGTRNAGGWSLGGLALPRSTSLLVRARGETRSGFANLSTSQIEIVRQVYLAPLPATLAMAGAPGTSVYGQAVTWNANLSTTFAPAGPVSFCADAPAPDAACSGGTLLCAPALPAADGSATCTSNALAVGAHAVAAYFAGDANNQAATAAPIAQTVTVAASATAIAPLAPIAFGQSLTVQATVAAQAPGAGTPGGTLTVTAGTAQCTAALTAGSGSCTLTPNAPGTLSVSAAYAGDSHFAASSGSASLEVIAHHIGGSLSGLAGSGLVLHLDAGNGHGEDLPVAAGATTFAFATPVPAGATYTIGVTTSPNTPSQTCTATPNTGTMPAADVSDIAVACTTNAYIIGGTVSGTNGGTLVLQNNGGNNLSVNGDGAFAFATPLASGATYAVTILTQPAGRVCSLGNASGSVGAGDVTSVGIACSGAPPQLVLSASDGRDFARYGQVLDYDVALANNGDGAALDVAVTFALPAGFDGTLAQFTCSGAGGGTTCTQDAGNPQLFHVALPAQRTLTWRVSVPVRANASGATVDFGVGATGATPAVDSDTLVIFRDGFDLPNDRRRRAGESDPRWRRTAGRRRAEASASGVARSRNR